MRRVIRSRSGKRQIAPSGQKRGANCLWEAKWGFSRSVRPIAPDFDGVALTAAADLIFKVRAEPKGCCKWLLPERCREVNPHVG